MAGQRSHGSFCGLVGNEYKKGSGCGLAGELAQPPMGMGMTLQYRIIIKSCLLVVYCWWLAHPRD